MALTNTFYEAVKANDVDRVRIMMKNSLLVDPTFDEFHEMEKVASSMTGLYDKYDGKKFIEDKSQWNNDYMDKIMVNVLFNFSHERIEHIKDVVRYLRPVVKKVAPKTQNTDDFQNSNNTSKVSYQEEKHRCQQNGDYLYAKIGIGAAAAAVAGGVVATIARASVGGIVGGIATGAVVGGVVTAVIISRGKQK